ncbi:MAG: DNA alkylation repair protein [Draconibacterium sp.]|nr:DNA alkylation repair protein [Draconibacterium sp.]
MDFILDNKDAEKSYKLALSKIKLIRNGDIADAMKRTGIDYKMNWGVSLVILRQMAKEFEPDHVLALKLWNKQWRETSILATLLDKPDKVNEEQMDYWTKTFENSEIAEQVSTNLWVKSKYAFIKALEWCRGKKHLVRFTGIHLVGRLAIADKQAIDEMFEPFFEEFVTLAKDAKLFTVLYRAIIALGTRSKYLNENAIELAKTLQLSNSENAIKLGEGLYEELTSDYVQERF